MQQNIYDNNEFFENYKNTRLSDNSFNELLGTAGDEKTDSRCTRQIGSGFRLRVWFQLQRVCSRRRQACCRYWFVRKQAKATNNTDSITYHIMSMVDIDNLNAKFDFVFSSLAFHYIEDFELLIKKYIPY